MKRLGRIALTAVMLAMFLVAGSQFSHAAKSFSGTMNINTATEQELTQLPGIGPAKAKAIMEYRAGKPFNTVEELKEVKGIGDKLFATLQPYLTVGGEAGSGSTKQ